MRKHVRNKKSSHEWTPACQEDFLDLKRALIEASFRSFAMFMHDTEKAGPFFRLTKDFSAKGMSAILSQEQNGKERLIACAGRKCSKPEQAYASIKGELAAIIVVLRKYDSF